MPSAGPGKAPRRNAGREGGSGVEWASESAGRGFSNRSARGPEAQLFSNAVAAEDSHEIRGADLVRVYGAMLDGRVPLLDQKGPEKRCSGKTFTKEVTLKMGLEESVNLD